MNDNYYDIAIIGGGASGLMLAANLDLTGMNVPAASDGVKAADRSAHICGEKRSTVSGIILEGGCKAGSKILMSGGGHCNITHGGSIKDFVPAYGSSGRALRSCLYRHSNLELARWFSEHGVPLADENGKSVELSYGSAGLENKGRIFPASMRSGDVLDALAGEADLNGWQIETGAKVCGLRQSGASAEMSGSLRNRALDGQPDDMADAVRLSAASPVKDGKTWIITLEDEFEISAGNVVIATGGITYPETGSDGSMFGLLEDLGLDIAGTRSALAPVVVEDYPYTDLSGVSLSDVTVVAFRSVSGETRRAKPISMKGDILFTHDGLSGPAILNISKYVEPGERIRLCYNKDMQDLPRRMQRMLRDRSRGSLGEVRTNKLASLLSQDDFIVDHVDKRGMVTAGGVSLDEIDMKTMQARKLDNIYVIGEALDADGITGGYNLQMCWSTACMAADSLREGRENGFI